VARVIGSIAFCVFMPTTIHHTVHCMCCTWTCGCWRRLSLPLLSLSSGVGHELGPSMDWIGLDQIGFGQNFKKTWFTARLSWAGWLIFSVLGFSLTSTRNFET